MSESSTALDRQPRAGCWLLAIPVIGTAVIVAAYIGITVLGFIGHPANGERVEIRYEACAEAGPVLQRRAEAMGLGDLEVESTSGAIRMTATLPADPGVAARVPDTLAVPGYFAVVDGKTGGEIAGPDRVETAFPHLKITGSPVTLVGLDDDGRRALALFVRDHPDGRVALEFDGERLAEIDTSDAPSGDDIEVPAAADDANLQLELAAGRAIAIQSGPMPCPVRIASVTAVAD